MSNPPPIRTQNSSMWRRPFQTPVHSAKAVRIHDFARTGGPAYWLHTSPWLRTDSTAAYAEEIGYRMGPPGAVPPLPLNDALRDPHTRAAAAPTPPLSAAPVQRAPLFPFVRPTGQADRTAGGRRVGAPPLKTQFGILLLALCAFWTLICARGWQVPPAGDLRVVLDITWRLPLSAETHLVLFGLLAVLMVAGWCGAYRAVEDSSIALPGVLLGAAVLGIPLLLLTGIYSDDVFLYHFYGRELAHYGANPYTTPPAAFAGDPLLKWVYWKWLPSAYGPLWLAVSAALSALAADSIAAAVVLYRTAGLLAHLAAVSVVYMAARALRPRHAVRAAAFYGWNPFVLFESVASAHNDALLIVFVCAVVAAITRERWSLAGILLACATMVKPFAALAAVPLATTMWTRSRERRIGNAVGATVAASLTILVLYAPFNAGDALLRNMVANPASGIYMNSLWELVAVQVGGWSGITRAWVENTWLDPARVALLALSLLAGAVVSLRTRRFPPGLIVLWTGFCLSQAWIWPWYFMPVIAMAAFEGRRAQRLAIALSLGGLLFYLGWPPPTKSLAWIYDGRSLLLFGPALLVMIVEGCSRLCWPGSRRTTAPAVGCPSGSR